MHTQACYPSQFQLLLFPFQIMSWEMSINPWWPYFCHNQIFLSIIFLMDCIGHLYKTSLLEEITLLKVSFYIICIYSLARVRIDNCLSRYHFQCLWNLSVKNYEAFYHHSALGCVSLLWDLVLGDRHETLQRIYL